MTRQEKIDKGLIWQVTEGEKLLFEGVKTKCIRYMQLNKIYRQWKNGNSDYHLSKIIWEKN